MATPWMRLGASLSRGSNAPAAILTKLEPGAVYAGTAGLDELVGRSLVSPAPVVAPVCCCAEVVAGNDRRLPINAIVKKAAESGRIREALERTKITCPFP